MRCSHCCQLTNADRKRLTAKAVRLREFGLEVLEQGTGSGRFSVTSRYGEDWAGAQSDQRKWRVLCQASGGAVSFLLCPDVLSPELTLL